MKKQLKELSDDSSIQSWKKHPEFFGYRDAIQGISQLGDVNKGGREFLVSCQLHFSEHSLLRTTSLLSPVGGIGRFFRTSLPETQHLLIRI